MLFSFGGVIQGTGGEGVSQAKGKEEGWAEGP